MYRLFAQVPSLTGKEDDEMEGDQLMFDLDQGFAQGFTQEQVDGKTFKAILILSPEIIWVCIMVPPITLV